MNDTLDQMIAELDLQGTRHRFAAIVVASPTQEIVAIPPDEPDRRYLLGELMEAGWSPLGMMVIDAYKRHAELTVMVDPRYHGAERERVRQALKKEADVFMRRQMARWGAKDVVRVPDHPGTVQ